MADLNQTPSANRVHIAFFGKRHAGKSSVVNAVTGQNISIVSDVKGTTTDPVQKAMELLPLGPVVIIDTPGMDDEGELGEMRVARARQVLSRTDLAVLLFKVRNTLFDHLLQLAVLGAALVFRDIAQFVQQDLLHAQRVSAQVVFHFVVPP